MSAWVRVNVAGLGVVSLNAPDAIVERIGDDNMLEADHVTAHAGGIDIQLSDVTLTYRPNAAGCVRWSDFFEKFTGELFGGRAPPLRLSLSGALLDGLQQRWHVERLKARAARGRGRPRRSDRWDDDREELYALILKRRQEHGDTLQEAIEVAAVLEPQRFRRAFDSIGAATIYFKRHGKDTPE